MLIPSSNRIGNHFEEKQVLDAATGRTEFNGMMNIRVDVDKVTASFCTIEASSKDAVKIDDADKNSAVVCSTASNVLDTKRV